MRIVKLMAILLLMAKAGGCGAAGDDAAAPVAMNPPTSSAAATPDDAASDDNPSSAVLLNNEPSEESHADDPDSIANETRQPNAAAPEPALPASSNPATQTTIPQLQREAREMELISAIRERPWDEQPVMDFADWLESRDKPRAELIRKQVQIAKLDYYNPARAELQKEVQELLAAHRARWTAPLGEIAEHASIRFGLIDRIELNEATDEQIAILTNAPELRILRLRSPKLTAAGYVEIARLPQLDDVLIEAETGGKNVLAAFEKLPPWTWLQLHIDDLDRRELNAMNERRLAKFQTFSPEEKALVAARWLNTSEYSDTFGGMPKKAFLSQAGIHNAEMQLLAGLPDLETVDISQSDITSAGIAHLAGLTKLTELGLWDTRVESIAPLAGLRNLKKLAIYSEYSTRMNDDALEGLENFTLLEDLFLDGERLADDTVKRLAPLVKLRKLELSIGKLQDENSLAALAGMKQLESLTLHGVEIGDSVMQHLAGLTELEMLNIRVHRGTGEDFKHLAGLKKLKYLTLHGKGVTDEALAQLAPLVELKAIVAQGGGATKEGGERLAAQLPRVTIILDEAVVKSPRASYSFGRRKLNDSVSLLLPTDWSNDERASRGAIWVREEGWERTGSWSGAHVGPADVRMHVDRNSPSAEAAVMASVNNNAHANPVVLQRNVQTIQGSDDVASCIYKNDFGKFLLSAAKTKDGFVILEGTVPESRFAEFEALFKFVIRSVRIGDDPQLHADETMEILAEKLDPPAPAANTETADER